MLPVSPNICLPKIKSMSKWTYKVLFLLSIYMIRIKFLLGVKMTMGQIFPVSLLWLTAKGHAVAVVVLALLSKVLPICQILTAAKQTQLLPNRQNAVLVSSNVRGMPLATRRGRKGSLSYYPKLLFVATWKTSGTKYLRRMSSIYKEKHASNVQRPCWALSWGVCLVFFFYGRPLKSSI